MDCHISDLCLQEGHGPFWKYMYEKELRAQAAGVSAAAVNRGFLDCGPWKIKFKIPQVMIPECLWPMLIIWPHYSLSFEPTMSVHCTKCVFTPLRACLCIALHVPSQHSKCVCVLHCACLHSRVCLCMALYMPSYHPDRNCLKHSGSYPKLL